MKRAVSAGIAGSIAGALAATGFGLGAIAQSNLGQTLAIEQPVSDDALRDQIRSVVGRAIENGESAETIDQLVNEAASEGKLFVPDTMRLPDGSVNTDALIAFMSGDQPSFQPPVEGVTAAAGASTGGATGSQLLQPSTGSAERTTAILQPAPAASGSAATGSQLLQPQSDAPAAPSTASGSQLLQPAGAAPATTTATVGSQILQPSGTAPETTTATVGSQILQPSGQAPATSTATVGSQILQPSGQAPATSTASVGSQILQPTEAADTEAAPSGADIATAAQIGAGASTTAAASASALQPLQPGQGDAPAEPADPAAAANALLLQPAEGTAGTAPAEPETAEATDTADTTDTAEAETSDSGEVALADPEPEPEPVPVVTTEDGEEVLYTVRRGDSLSTIAERMLGDPFRFEEIFEANRDRLSNPNVIVEGQRLRIPR